MLNSHRKCDRIARFSARIGVIALLAMFPLMANAQQAGDKKIVAVEASKVAIGPLSERVLAVGSLRSNESVVIRPEIAGKVVEIGFEEGQPVEEGSLLLKLDDSLNQAEIAEAQARLDLAQRNFSRTEELFTNKIATARSRDEAESSLAVGTATVELAKVRLAKTRIMAPFSGIAGLRQVSVGDYVSVGQDLFNLEDITPIKVDFRVSEKFLPSVRTDQPIEITVDAYPGEIFTGTVYAIDPRIDAEGRSIVIRARVANDDQRLRPGLFARVKLILELKQNAVTVPEQAIMPRGNDQFVYTIVDGKAKQTKVMIGTRRDGRVEIVEGLGTHDMVVTAGHQKIRDGAAVEIIQDGGKGA